MGLFSRFDDKGRGAADNVFFPPWVLMMDFVSYVRIKSFGVGS